MDHVHSFRIALVTDPSKAPKGRSGLVSSQPQSGTIHHSREDTDTNRQAVDAESGSWRYLHQKVSHCSHTCEAENRKQSWAVKAQGRLHLSASCIKTLPPQVPTALPNSATSWGKVCKLNEPMGDTSHSNHSIYYAWFTRAALWGFSFKFRIIPCIVCKVLSDLASASWWIHPLPGIIQQGTTTLECLVIR